MYECVTWYHERVKLWSENRRRVDKIIHDEEKSWFLPSSSATLPPSPTTPSLAWQIRVPPPHLLRSTSPSLSLLPARSWHFPYASIAVPKPISTNQPTDNNTNETKDNITYLEQSLGTRIRHSTGQSLRGFFKSQKYVVLSTTTTGGAATVTTTATTNVTATHFCCILCMLCWSNVECRSASVLTLVVYVVLSYNSVLFPLCKQQRGDNGDDDMSERSCIQL